MNAVRALIRDHRRLAMALVVLAFCIKAIVPAGFMVSHASPTLLTISVCSEITGAHKTVNIVVPPKDDGSEYADEAKGSHCAFAGLGHMALSGADLVLLAMAFAVVLALGLAPVTCPPFRRISYLQPPLRGPPAAA